MLQDEGIVSSLKDSFFFFSEGLNVTFRFYTLVYMYI